jgi:hypothetical protein
MQPMPVSETLAPPTAQEIVAAITQYAAAYATFEALQRRARVAPPAERLLPIGDQKTGAVGEFYARLYLAHRHPDRAIHFSAQNAAWDLEVASETPGAPPHRVQVKCVSAHSTTRTLSAISGDSEEMLVIAVDDGFFPAGFWVIDMPNVVPKDALWISCRSPHLTNPRARGTARLQFGPNRIDELRAALAAQGLVFPVVTA